MESEMVQNSTSNFSITFNKYDQIQDHVFIKINKCDLIQPKKFNQLQRKVKKPITINKKNDQIQQFAISENHIQEERKTLSTNPKILYECCSAGLDWGDIVFSRWRTEILLKGMKKKNLLQHVVFVVGHSSRCECRRTGLNFVERTRRDAVLVVQ